MPQLPQKLKESLQLQCQKRGSTTCTSLLSPSLSGVTVSSQLKSIPLQQRRTSGRVTAGFPDTPECRRWYMPLEIQLKTQSCLPKRRQRLGRSRAPSQGMSYETKVPEGRTETKTDSGATQRKTCLTLDIKGHGTPPGIVSFLFSVVSVHFTSK